MEQITKELFSNSPVAQSHSNSVDIDTEISNIKNKKFFDVPDELAADRYVNLLKMVSIEFCKNYLKKSFEFYVFR